MTTVLCMAQSRGTICTQILCRIGRDFTGVIEVKCPRCRTVHTRTFTDGTAHVA